VRYSFKVLDECFGFEGFFEERFFLAGNFLSAVNLFSFEENFMFPLSRSHAPRVSSNVSEVARLVSFSSVNVIQVMIDGVEWVRVLHVKECVRHYFELQRRGRPPFEFQPVENRHRVQIHFFPPSGIIFKRCLSYNRYK
jgi:hypothetical protein